MTLSAKDIKGFSKAAATMHDARPVEQGQGLPLVALDVIGMCLFAGTARIVPACQIYHFIVVQSQSVTVSRS